MTLSLPATASDVKYCSKSMFSLFSFLVRHNIPNPALGKGREESSALTLSSSWSFVPKESERHNPASRRDSILPERALPTISPVRQRFSIETSLRLMTPEEEEMGAIRYQFTCLDDAAREATKCQKPMLCIEVDIPGDVKTGREVLSHPLIVEAAETLFVSVFCRMRKVPVNVPGKHCYTKVRILDDDGADLVAPLMGKLLCVAKVASAMIEALSVWSQHVPTYLQLLEEEHYGYRILVGPSGCFRRTDRQAVFGVACSKRGEVDFAGIDGVLATRAGYYDRNQVVRVTYDSTQLSYCSLVRYALQRDVAKTIFFQTNEERVLGTIESKRLNIKADLVKFLGPMQPSVDPKHALRKTMLRFVPLTDLQASRANRLVDMGAFHEAVHLLSPRQGQILMRSIQNSKRMDVTDLPITSSWKSLLDSTTTEMTQ